MEPDDVRFGRDVAVVPGDIAGAVVSPAGVASGGGAGVGRRVIDGGTGGGENDRRADKIGLRELQRPGRAFQLILLEPAERVTVGTPAAAVVVL